MVKKGFNEKYLKTNERHQQTMIWTVNWHLLKKRYKSSSVLFSSTHAIFFIFKFIKERNINMPDNVAATKRETVQKNLPKEISDGFS